MTPNLEPFFAGTYFPRARFQAVLMKIADLWEDDRSKCEEMGKNVIEQLKDLGGSSVNTPPEPGTVKTERLFSPAYLALSPKCCPLIPARKSLTIFDKRTILDTAGSRQADHDRPVRSFRVAR